MDSGHSDSSPAVVSADAHLDALLSRADLAAVRVSALGSVVAVNDAFLELAGYDRSALLERPASSVLGVDVAGAADDGSAPTTVDLEVRTADGSSVPCTAHLQRRAAEGDESAIIALIERRSEGIRPTTTDAEVTYGKTFAALADAVTDGIIVLDAESDVQYANPAVERILGYPPETLVGGSKVEMIPDRLRQVHLDALDRYLETGEKHINWTYVELPGQHRDGHEVPLGISLNDFTFDGERYFVGLFRDISERKAVERRLAEKVAQLETVAHLGRRALAATDLDVLFDEATELVADVLDASYCKVLELEPVREELLLRSGVGWEDGLVGEATVSASDAASQAGYTLESGEPVVVEDLRSESRFDGPKLLTDHGVRSGISVTIGPSTSPWGILGVHDEAVREFADHDVDFVETVATLLATAIDRTRHERRLDEAVDELEASNERLEQFAYAASHDLQEPLRMISSYLQLIDRRYGDRLDEDGREFLAYAVDGADRLREMIDGLLQYSRVERGGEPLEPVDCETVLEEVLEDLQVQIAECDADVTVESLPTVLGDRSQLRQVFQNLVSNAIEYGDDGPQIHVGVDRDGEEWAFSVSDDGIGIEEADRERIFEVFQRLERADASGTGIGLALCRRIVERHGGEIWVESTPGEGSTFFFTLRPADPAAD